MKSSAPVKAIAAAAVACYPFAVFFAIKSGCGEAAVAVLTIAVLLGFFINRQKILLVGGISVIALSAVLGRAELVKFYPVVMNFTVMAVFALSLKKKPLVQIIGEKMRGALPQKGVEYARKATFAWAVFMFFLALCSLATVFMPNEVWAAFNGFLSYVLIALMFFFEYLARRKALKDVC